MTKIEKTTAKRFETKIATLGYFEILDSSETPGFSAHHSLRYLLQEDPGCR